MRNKKESENFEGYYFNTAGLLVVDFNWADNLLQIDITEK